MTAPRIALLIDSPPSAPYHRATIDALHHAADGIGRPIDVRTLPTDTPDLDDAVRTCAGILVGPGSPYRDEVAVWRTIAGARERGIPLVGTWGGFQHVLVEHARNVIEIPDARHRESSEDGTPVVSLLACSLTDTTITIAIAPGTRTAALYGDNPTAVERTTCSYGLNPEHMHIAHEGGMVVTATDDTDEVRAIERSDHPFFVATLFQPQLSSGPGAPHPILEGFVEACG